MPVTEIMPGAFFGVTEFLEERERDFTVKIVSGHAEIYKFNLEVKWTVFYYKDASTRIIKALYFNSYYKFCQYIHDS